MSSFEPAAAEHGLERAAAEHEAAANAVDREAGTEPAADPQVQPAAVAAEPGAPSRVAAAVAELDRLPDLELAEHPDLYQRIHTELQGALSAIDDA
jgi:hypothetical protein